MDLWYHTVMGPWRGAVVWAPNAQVPGVPTGSTVERYSKAFKFQFKVDKLVPASTRYRVPGIKAKPGSENYLELKQIQDAPAEDPR